MIKCAALPEMTFDSQKALFKCLLQNEQKIIAVKKAAVQKSIDKGQLGYYAGLKIDATKAEWMDDNYIYPVINTTKYMDSHDDVHFDGIWNKTLKENGAGLFYCLDHELKVSEIIAWPGEVEAFTKSIPWAMVGKDYEGETEALIYKISKDKIENADALKVINAKRPVQNSVRMQYVKMKLAINSTDSEFKAHKEYFDSRIDQVANKDVAVAKGFFWGHEEAKIIKEGSMVVFGSNDATPIGYKEAVTDTPKKEPDFSTHTDQLKEILNKFN